MTDSSALWLAALWLAALWLAALWLVVQRWTRKFRAYRPDGVNASRLFGPPWVPKASKIQLLKPRIVESRVFSIEMHRSVMHSRHQVYRCVRHIGRSTTSSGVRTPMAGVRFAR